MNGTRLFCILFSALSPAALSQDLPSHPKPGAAICVAVISNMSARSAMLERLTQRLTKNLKDEKIKALAMDSRTTTDPQLHPTQENGEEAKSNECDYMLLTQI